MTDSPLEPVIPPSNSPFAQPINPTAQALAQQPPKTVTHVAAPGAAEWAEMSPDARAEFTRSQSDGGRTSASVHTRTPDGRPLIDGRLPDGTTPQPEAATPPVDPAAPPSGDQTFKVGAYEVSESQLATMMERQAQEDLRRVTLPPSPDAYKIELAPEVKVPAGVEFKINEADPGIQAVKNLAHAKGWSQSDLNDVISIYPSNQIQQEAQIADARQREVAKLGSTAPMRIDTVTTWLAGIDSSPDKGDAKALAGMLVTARHVEAFERLMHRIASQGVSSFSQKHRDVDTGRVSEEQWAKMSYGEKKDYAAKHGAR